MSVNTVPTLARPSHLVIPDAGTGFTEGPAIAATQGARILIELSNPANGDAIYTVPANKTFTGRLVIRSHAVASSQLGASAATGGSLGTCGGGAVALLTNDITVAGGGGGNAITATVTGSALGRVMIEGYVT